MIDLKVQTMDIIKQMEERSLDFSLRMADTPSLQGVDEIVEKQCQSLASVQAQRLRAEFSGWGPLEPLLDNPEINEIIVNGPNSIWYEDSGRLCSLSDEFYSSVTYKNFVERVLKESKQLTTLDHPFANGKISRFRVHVASPPITSNVTLTFRAHNKNGWTLQDLEKMQWASSSELKYLKQMLHDKKNFLVVGPTGAGKTSVLNSCLRDLPENERAVLIEDTEELNLPNSLSTRMLTRHDAQNILRPIDQTELVRQSLRMRPDRIIMGEIRGTEAKDLLMAFATGHQGCMGTLHAETARQALIRLEMLIQLGAPQWSLQAVRSLILMSVNHIVVVKREGPRRCLEGIYKLSSLEEVGFLIEKVGH